ncbi:uncharacterized protein TNIN_179161 [Trichonephila inaurata madagascariensis]|uniref:Uncharacterized protein n=1 Tax=Trichonephila inaurata madagascariensis TaxID=2747483 RepID=A0A8X6Y962_9ARAC|nr:uncharacterized protein TNIN_179161 [Trichonephila inaurata madagascariensis]
MSSVQQVLELCQRDTCTIIFGNLGRYPSLLNVYLKDFNGIIWIEPNFGETIHKPAGITMIVLSSHLDLVWDEGGTFLYELSTWAKIYGNQTSRKQTSVNGFYPHYYHDYDLKSLSSNVMRSISEWETIILRYPHLLNYHRI